MRKDNKVKAHKSSLFLETIQRIWENAGAKVGTILFIVIVLLCICAPVIAPYGLNDMDLSSMYKGPSLQHLFGTDGMGRDLLTRLLYGGRYSLALGLCAALFGSGFGSIIGSIAGVITSYSIHYTKLYDCLDGHDRSVVESCWLWICYPTRGWLRN